MTADFRRLAVVLALGLLAAFVPVPETYTDSQAAVAPSVPLGGVNIRSLESGSEPSDIDRDIVEAHLLHAKIVRTSMNWSMLEPLRPNRLDQHAMALVDRVMRDASAAGIRVIMTVQATPCWASAAPARLLRRCVPGHQSEANRWPPRDPAEYARFVALVAKRYGTRLAAIEIWNEPDNSNERFFAGPEKASRYAAIVIGGYQGPLRRLIGALLHSPARLAAIDPTGPDRGWRHDAVVARRVRLEQLLAAVQNATGTTVRDEADPGSKRSRRNPVALQKPVRGGRDTL
jgi:hypothetical protein